MALVPSVAAAQGASAEDRQGLYLGLGLGGGRGVAWSDAEAGGREMGLAGGLRMGYAFGPGFGVGLESTAWTRNEDGDIRSTIGVVALAASFFPAEGAVMRVGVGVGFVEGRHDLGWLSKSETGSGTGLIFGAGYEFRVTDALRIGPGLDAVFVTSDQFAASGVNASLTLAWYHNPK